MTVSENNVTAETVKSLRLRTGAAIMDCKRALLECQGDLEKAEETLRKAGQVKAGKKEDRVVTEGTMAAAISTDKTFGFLMEVNCETDFVARDDHFLSFVKILQEHALNKRLVSREAVLTLVLEDGETLEEKRKALVAKMGENIQLRRYVAKQLQANSRLFSYVHANRIGALVELAGAQPERFEAWGKDIAMQVVAHQPLFIRPSDIPPVQLEKEKDIFYAQYASSGKPSAVIDKMVESRIKKFFDETCLYHQPFLKRPDKTVGELLGEENIEILGFIRWAVGEGIQKKTEDFASEVMKQVQGSQ